MTNMRSNIFLTLLLQAGFLVFLCCLQTRDANATTGARLGFRRLSDYVNSNCKLKNANKCFDMMKKELDRRNKMKARIFPDRKLEHALANTLLLRNILDDPQCTAHEMIILQRVAKYSNGHAYYERPISSLTPFDFLVHSVCLKRAKFCMEIYPELAPFYYARIPSEVKQMAEFKKEALLAKQSNATFSANPSKFMEYLIDFRLTGTNEDVEDALAHIKKLSIEDEDRCNFEAMRSKYLAQPCLDYSTQFNWFVVKQLDYDSQMFEGLSGFNLDESKAAKLIPYYLMIAQSRACTDQARPEFIEKLKSRWNCKAKA